MRSHGSRVTIGCHIRRFSLRWLSIPFLFLGIAFIAGCAHAALDNGDEMDGDVTKPYPQTVLKAVDL
jgi:hypothetical protein